MSVFSSRLFFFQWRVSENGYTGPTHHYETLFYNRFHGPARARLPPQAIERKESAAHVWELANTAGELVSTATLLCRRYLKS